MNTHLLFAGVPCALLAACGSSHRVASEPTADTVITADNLQEVAGRALAGALGLTDLGAIGTGVLSRTEGALHGLDLKDFVGRWLSALDPPQVVLPLLVTRTETGPEGGSRTYTWDDRDGDEKVSTGDSFAITFAGYGEAGLLLNGLVQIDRLVVFGDPSTPSTWRLQARLSLVNLLATQAGATQVLDGVLMSRVERRPTVSLLSLAVDTALGTEASTLLSSGLVDWRKFLDDSYWLAASGTVADLGAGGTLTYRTADPFRGFTFDPFPSAGVLEVLGAGKSRLVITVQDSSTVQIETDTDGDGLFDDTRSVAWTEL